MANQVSITSAEGTYSPSFNYANDIAGVGTLSMHLAQGNEAAAYKQLMARAFKAGLEQPMAISPTSAHMLGTETYDKVGFTYNATGKCMYVWRNKGPRVAGGEPRRLVVGMLHSSDMGSPVADTAAPVAVWKIRRTRTGGVLLNARTCGPYDFTLSSTGSFADQIAALRAAVPPDGYDSNATSIASCSDADTSFGSTEASSSESDSSSSLASSSGSSSDSDASSVSSASSASSSGLAQAAADSGAGSMYVDGHGDEYMEWSDGDDHKLVASNCAAFQAPADDDM